MNPPTALEALRDQVSNAAISEERGLYSFDPKAWGKVCTPPVIRSLLKAYDEARSKAAALHEAATAVLDTEFADIACTGSMAPVEDALGRLKDALAQPAESAEAGPVPAGWKLVPVEPTVEMGQAYLDGARLHAAFGAEDKMRFSWGGYRALLAASPAAPAPQPAGMVELTRSEIAAALDAAKIGHQSGEDIVRRPWWSTQGSVSVQAITDAITRAIAAKNGLALAEKEGATP